MEKQGNQVDWKELIFGSCDHPFIHDSVLGSSSYSMDDRPVEVKITSPFSKYPQPNRSMQVNTSLRHHERHASSQARSTGAQAVRSFPTSTIRWWNSLRRSPSLQSPWPYRISAEEEVRRNRTEPADQVTSGRDNPHQDSNAIPQRHGKSDPRFHLEKQKIQASENNS